MACNVHASKTCVQIALLHTLCTSFLLVTLVVLHKNKQTHIHALHLQQQSDVCCTTEPQVLLLSKEFSALPNAGR